MTRLRTRLFSDKANQFYAPVSMTCIFTATKIEISQENVKQRRQFSVRGTIIDRKNVPPPCNHLDIGALRLPTLARNRGGD